MINAAQIRAARALIDWSQADLAARSGYSLPAISHIERGLSAPRVSTLTTLQQTLEEAGVEFTDGTGVRLQAEVLHIKMVEGAESLRTLYADIYETLAAEGGTVLLSGIDERNFVRADEQAVVDYVMQCRDHGGIKNLILYREGDTYFLDTEDVSEFRWIPHEVFGLVPTYVYDDKHAIVLWGPPLRVIITHNAAIAETYRKQFMANWKTAKAPDGCSKN